MNNQEERDLLAELRSDQELGPLLEARMAQALAAERSLNREAFSVFDAVTSAARQIDADDATHVRLMTERMAERGRGRTGPVTMPPRETPWQPWTSGGASIAGRPGGVPAAAISFRDVAGADAAEALEPVDAWAPAGAELVLRVTLIPHAGERYRATLRLYRRDDRTAPIFTDRHDWMVVARIGDTELEIDAGGGSDSWRLTAPLFPQELDEITFVVETIA